MVEVNPQEVPTESKEVETNIYVAQTAGKPEDLDQLLESVRSWITIRAFSEEEVQASGQLLNGNLVFAELNNIPKEIAIEMLKMVLDTVENGEQLNPDEMEEENQE